jgi:hypothetical protein
VGDLIFLDPSLQRVYTISTKTTYSVIRGTRMSKINRNDPCPCGSGKKYKKCCGLKEQQARKPRLSNPISVLSQISGDKGSPVDLARRVFKVLTGTAQTPTTAPSQPESEPTVAPTPRGFSSLEELIGVEGAPNPDEKTTEGCQGTGASEK